jgi:chloramphenicol O-acetyltransferase type A
MRKIDRTNWIRKEHFDFFSKFDEPFFGIVSEVDCTIAYRYSKEEQHSFFSYYLHKSIIAANSIEEFKYRIVDDDVVVYDEIHASPTIARDDGSFGFSFMEYNTDFSIFNSRVLKEISEVKNSTGLRLNDEASRNNVIHYSSIPWIQFSGLTHARNYKIGDSAPKITFGKMVEEGNIRKMNVAVYVHHGLADASHIALFLERFQNLLDSKI